MKLNSRKVLGFIIIIIILVVLFAILLKFDRSLLKELGPTIISSMLIAYGVFVGSNSTDKFITSKWFIKDKYESEKEE